VARSARGEKVVLFSRRTDAKGRLLQRLKVRGDRLTWDAQREQIDIAGAGKMVVEDYRPPRKPDGRAEDDGDADLTGDGVRRPFQTAFTWEKLMTLNQAKRRAIMEGRVRMAHASGKHLVLARELNVPDWGKLAAGRFTRLSCGKLIAKFAPAEPDEPETATRPAADSGPRIGPLTYFEAIGDVNLKDGVREVRWIIAERLLYNRPTELVEIYGALPGEPKKNARLQFDNLDTRRSRTIRSPKILWFRKTDKIIADEISGAGAQ
jgi:hypothetical protein